MKINIADLIQGQEILDQLKDNLFQINKELETLAGQAKITFETIQKTSKTSVETSQKETEAVDKLAKAYDRSKQLFDETEAEIRAVEIAMKDLKKIQDLELKAALQRNKTYKQTETELKLVTEKLKNLTDEEKKSSEEGKKLVETRRLLLIEQAKYRKAQREEVQIAKATAKLNDSASTSYDKLSAQYTLNKIALNKMTVAERELTEEGKLLVFQTDKIYEEMKRLQAETGNTSLNVGNYAEANRELIDVLGRIPGSNNLIVSSLANVAGGFDKGGQKTAAFTKRLNKLARHPIVAFLLLIVGTLSAVGSAFFRTSKGVEVLDRIQGALQGGLAALSSIAGKLGTAIYDAFSNPKEAVQGLWDSIKQNIVDRFDGLKGIFTNFGSLLKSVFTGNIDGVKESAKEMGFSLQQAVTGITKEDFNELSEGFDGITKTIADNVKGFADLRRAQRSTRFENVELNKELSALEVELAKVSELVGDGTISFEANREAIAKTSELEQKIADRRVKIAQNNLDLIQKEIGIRKANGQDIIGLLEQEEQGIALVSQARQEAIRVQAKLERESRQEYQDRLERDLDFEIDLFDKRKTVIERQLKDETISFKDREKLLEDLEKLRESSFDNQIAILQKFTDKQIDADKLLADSNGEYTRSLGLSEIIEGRSLEIIRDQLIARQDLTDSTKELIKSQNDYNDAKAKEETREKFEDIRIQFELRKSEIELLESTEEEKTRLMIEAEIDRLEKIRALRVAGGEKLASEEIQIITNQIKKLEKEVVPELTKKEFSIYNSFGITDPQQKEAFTEAIGFIKGQLLDIAKQNTQLANQRVQESQSTLQAAQNDLLAEIALKDQGIAADIEGAKERVEIARKENEQRLKDQRDAQQVELALSSIQETANLTLAATKIYSQVGNPAIAIPLISLMFGSYILAKAKALELTKRTNRKGTFEALTEGTTHELGDDINVAYTRTSDIRAEKGEGLSVWTALAMRDAGLLEEITNAANMGQLHEYLHQAQGGGVVINMDNSELVAEMRKGKKEVYFDGRYRVVKSGNRTKKYIA